MYRRFKVNLQRSKAYWPSLGGEVVRQLDFTLFFDVSPTNVQGWYSVPRQSAMPIEQEVGAVIQDYGPTMQGHELGLNRPFITQDALDGFSMLAYYKPGTTWMLWNHRGDRYEATPFDNWSFAALGKSPELAYAPEPGLFSNDRSRYTFWSDASGIFYAREDGLSIYFGEAGSEVLVAQGQNASVIAAADGRRYVAYQRGNKLFVVRQDATGAWEGEKAILRDDADFADGPLFDPAATYHDPALLLVGDRVWLMYLKTKDGTSVVQYRLEVQDFLAEHTIPGTVEGPKTSLRAGVITENPAYLGRIMIAYINWDALYPGASARVPNLYYKMSTPPQVSYGAYGTQIIRQSNYVPALSVLSAPEDSLEFELIRR